MHTKEIFDSYMRLAELRTQRATNRQAYEWRVTFGFWAALTAAAIYLKERPMPLWLGMAAVLIYAFFWLRAVYVAHWMDNGAARLYLEEALRILEKGHKPIQSSSSRMGWTMWMFGFLTEWGCLFQLLSTILLVYFFYLVNNPDALPTILRTN